MLQPPRCTSTGSMTMGDKMPIILTIFKGLHQKNLLARRRILSLLKRRQLFGAMLRPPTWHGVHMFHPMTPRSWNEVGAWLVLADTDRHGMAYVRARDDEVWVLNKNKTIFEHTWSDCWFWRRWRVSSRAEAIREPRIVNRVLHCIYSWQNLIQKFHLWKLNT